MGKSNNWRGIAIKFDGPEESRRMGSRSKVLEKEKSSQVGVEVETVLQTKGIFEQTDEPRTTLNMD